MELKEEKCVDIETKAKEFNILAKKINMEEDSEAKIDEATGKRIQARVSIAKALSDAKEDNRKKAPKTNENKKDDKSSAETPNRSVRPLKPTKKGKSVLDEGEKKYLEAVLAPFKGKIVSISKVRRPKMPCVFGNGRMRFEERIVVELANGYFMFPWFIDNSIYKRIVGNCGYSPKEFGLWKK